ncbi:hypothetical protein BC827DRAFT_1159796 [Russula dissimulans]|nr:hypothetical protein BC827DRAFT_1159893 [Russula dissimulans]KAH9952424.1 hypothetical protein BC827DRAFT_1159796 [Russula dissimulans]
MAPRTWKSMAISRSGQTEGQLGENQVPLQGSTEINTSSQVVTTSRKAAKAAQQNTVQPNNNITNPETPAMTMKQPRKIGPTRSRPMSLTLAVENERASPLRNDVGVIQAVQVMGHGLQRESSFYPGRGQVNHPLAASAAKTQELGCNDDDSNAESDEDLADDSHLAQGNISEAMAIERPSWQAPTAIGLSTLAGTSTGGVFVAVDVDTSPAPGTMPYVMSTSGFHTSNLSGKLTLIR